MLVKIEALCVLIATSVAVTGVLPGGDEVISHQVALAGACADVGAALVFVAHRWAHRQMAAHGHREG